MSVILLPVDAANCAFEAGTAGGSDTAKWTSPTQNSLGDLVKDHKVIFITGSIVVIAGVATVVVNKKRKRVK